MKIIIICLSLLFSVCISMAREVTFAWDRNPEPDVTVYRLYIFDTGTLQWVKISEVVDDPDTPANDTPLTMKVLNFPDVESRVRITAINSHGLESLPSNEVIVHIAPGAPNGLKYTIKFIGEITITPIP